MAKVRNEKYKPTYEDYEELAVYTRIASEALFAAVTKARQMWPVRSTLEQRLIYRLWQASERIRSTLDDSYCRDIPECEVPEEKPKFTFYGTIGEVIKKYLPTMIADLKAKPRGGNHV